MVFEDFKIYKRKQELTAQIALYQKQIQDMKNSSQKLKEEIANANSTDYLEKLGYEQFGETKPGETEYMFVKTPKKVETVAPKSNSWFGWLGQSWNWLKSKF